MRAVGVGGRRSWPRAADVTLLFFFFPLLFLSPAPAVHACDVFIASGFSTSTCVASGAGSVTFKPQEDFALPDAQRGGAFALALSSISPAVDRHLPLFAHQDVPRCASSTYINTTYIFSGFHVNCRFYCCMCEHMNLTAPIPAINGQGFIAASPLRVRWRCRAVVAVLGDAGVHAAPRKHSH